MTSASADSELPRLVASAPNGRQRLRETHGERVRNCANTRRQNLHFYKSSSTTCSTRNWICTVQQDKNNIGQNNKKQKIGREIQFHFIFSFGFGFGVNKRLAINCVLIFVSHFEMGSQSFFSSGQALQMSDELLLIAKVFDLSLSVSLRLCNNGSGSGKRTTEEGQLLNQHVT